MSNIPISSLPLAIALTGAEEFPIVQGGTTKRTTVGILQVFPLDPGLPFVVAEPAGLPGQRLLAGESGVVSITDGGGGSDITVGIEARGISNAKLAAADEGTVLAGQGLSSDPSYTATPILGVEGSTLGSLAFAGDTSGVVTVLPQSEAGTFNFNLPITAGAAGQALLSGGGDTDPMVFDTLGVGAGGSGRTETIPYAVICGGETNTGPEQSVASLGSLDQVLTSNGPAALPSFKSISRSEPVTQVTTSSAAIAAGTPAVAVVRTAPTATALTLPAIASQGGVPIHIFDWSNTVTSHTITITPNGSETIMKQSSWPLMSNTAQLSGVTLYPSTTLNGWYIAP